MSSATSSAYTLKTPCATCPTTRRSSASSPLALSPGSAKIPCRCKTARAPGQHDRGSPSLPIPTWTTLGCGDSTRPPVRSCLPRSSLARTFQAALCRQRGSCGLRSLSVLHPGHGLHAKRRLRPPPCFGWRVIGFVVRCPVCVQAIDVGVYVRGAACCACCGVPQRRHNFYAVLRRLGKHQPQELVRHWLGTATRNSAYQMTFYVDTYVSHDSVNHGYIQSCKKKAETNGLQLLRVWRAICGSKTSQRAAHCIPLKKDVALFFSKEIGYGDGDSLGWVQVLVVFASLFFFALVFLVRAVEVLQWLHGSPHEWVSSY